MYTPIRISSVSATLLLTTALTVLAQPQPRTGVFSGPQTGEPITPFEVVELRGPDAGTKRDPITLAAGRAVTLVFVHGIERSMAPLMTVVDAYGASVQEGMHTEFVFLSDDPVRAREYFPRVAQSLRIQSPMGLSVDGLEGPGNYGLNKECLLTVVIGDEGKAVANFALVQPGIADAPRIIEAMAAAAGDPDPPSAEQLQAMRQPGNMARRPVRRARETDRRTAAAAPLDPAQFNLETEAGLRDAVTRLLTEVKELREEIAALRSDDASAAATNRERERGMTPEMTRAQPMKAREALSRNLPGAAPTDANLVNLLRQFIQKSNRPEDVDAVLSKVDLYIQDQPALRKQAIDGWTRILHLDYGTEYAVEAGTAKLEEWKRAD